MKKTSLSVLTLGVMVSLAACSKTEKPTQTTTASFAASTVVTTAPAPVATPTTASTPPTIAASTVVVAPASTPANPLIANPTAPVTTQAATQPANPAATAANPAGLALKADLTQLIRTLNQLDRDSAAKQAEMAKKMQNAKTPADQQAFFKDVVTQLDIQKAALQKLKFNDPRVDNVRDKMVESINHSRSGTQALSKNPTATPETHPKIAKDMQASQQSAEQARDMLMKLTEEAGIQQKAPAKAK